MAILRRALWLVLIVAAVGAVTWRPQAIAEAQAQSGAAVRTAPAGHRVGATPGKKGATDYWLESQTTRLTAKYSDGTTAVAGRGTDGNFETKLSDRSGGEVGRFTVNRAAADGGADIVLHYAARSGEALYAYGEANVRPTLAWANTQAFSLSRDGGPAAASGFEWRNGLMRRRGAGARDVEQQCTGAVPDRGGSSGRAGRAICATPARCSVSPAAATARGRFIRSHSERCP